MGYYGLFWKLIWQTLIFVEDGSFEPTEKVIIGFANYFRASDCGKTLLFIVRCYVIS